MSFELQFHVGLLGLQGGLDAVFCVGRDENVATDVDSCARSFLERDNRKTIEKVIENLFSLFACLGRHTVADLRGGVEYVVIPDLGKSAQPAYGGRNGKGLEIAVIDLGSDTRGPERVEAGE